ncbi:PfkB family carbohydrate kinase [Rhizobacter sp. LjRoot28]|uniref:PfkB family carbohydrate kinase n=1 Tax=Rhizobacter sp. LjRoot28 TaxID=3342309 RepID=UPI003ED0B98C
MDKPLDERDPVLLSLGSINADFEMRTDEAPGAKETLAAHDLVRLSGGKAANRAALARRLGCAAWLLGRVGTDDLAAQALQPLRDAGVDLDGVLHGAPGTAVSIITVPPDGKKRIVLAGRSNLAFSAAEAEEVASRVAAAPSGSVLTVDFEVSPDAASKAITRARQGGIRVVVDPSFPNDVPLEILREVDVLTPNVEEAFALAGLSERPDSSDPHAIQEAARRLADLGPGCVCVKLEDGGCLVLHDGRCWYQGAAAPDKVVDTSGAGDAFTGAFAVALLSGCDVATAAVHGVAAGEMAVAGYGSQPAYPDRQALDARMALAREREPWPGSFGRAKGR